jgi:hypothetical protein
MSEGSDSVIKHDSPIYRNLPNPNEAITIGYCSLINVTRLLCSLSHREAFLCLLFAQGENGAAEGLPKWNTNFYRRYLLFELSLSISGEEK